VGAGGLGHIGIQCLKAMTSAQVIAVDTSEDALKLALSCGADHMVSADGQQAQQVRDLTGSGADAVFDCTNPDLAGLVTLTGQGKVVLHSTRYPLEAANDAIDDLRHGRIRGRAILIPG
jgi:NAD+-dependent secondary alcohol dehydrogenase Adh1